MKEVHAAAEIEGWKVADLQPAGMFSHVQAAPGGAVDRCFMSSLSSNPDHIYTEMQNLPERCMITCTDSELKRVGSVGNPIMHAGICTVGIFAGHLSTGKTASPKTT